MQFFKENVKNNGRKFKKYCGRKCCTITNCYGGSISHFNCLGRDKSMHVD